MPKKLSKQLLKEAVNNVNTFQSYKIAADKLKIPISTLKSRCIKAESLGIAKVKLNQSNKSSTKFEVVEEENSAKIESISETVRTVEDALRKGNIDVNVWEVYKSTINSWEVCIKQQDWTPKVVQLWQVKVDLKRKVAKIYEDAANGLIERMKKHSPKYPKIIRKRNVKDQHLLEISLFDVHFGKLAWSGETNNNYDLKIAESLYHKAIDDLINKSSGYNISQIVFPIGQDFFHIDNPTKTTVNGTPQDVDSRYSKLFEVGVMACVKAIDKIMQLAPVHVLYVPGNHDRTAAWHLCSNLSAWYRLTSDVHVDSTPTLRKYFQYGVNLIGFTHGDEEPHRDLPTIMASEVPQMWADTKFREIHIGHFHKKKEMTHKTVDQYGPIVVRILPSLSATDSWHYMKGYLATRRAAEAYLWSKELGYSGHFSSNVI